MLVGATGSGKSTLIDGIINYITDVSWDDDFRFSLVDLTEDEKKKQTNQVKYKLFSKNREKCYCFSLLLLHVYINYVSTDK
jgi:ABC-type lipoprotein export system ATPase subunit